LVAAVRRPAPRGTRNAGDRLGPPRLGANPLGAHRPVASARVDGGLSIARGVTVPLSEIELRTSRSSGPGGQHANVTASRVEAVFDVDASRVLDDGQKRRITARCGPVVRAVAQDTRSQMRNRELALERLRARLEAALHVPRARRATKPTAASRQRRVDTKRRRGDVKRQRRRPADE
jgi:ribosome-associated protein